MMMMGRYKKVMSMEHEGNAYEEEEKDQEKGKKHKKRHNSR